MVQLQLLKPPRNFPSEVKKTCLLMNQHQMKCSLPKVPLSVLDPALPLNMRRLEVPSRLALQPLPPPLAHFRTSRSVDLPLSNRKDSESDCVWSQRTLCINSGGFNPESMSQCVSGMFLLAGKLPTSCHCMHLTLSTRILRTCTSILRQRASMRRKY